MRVRQGRAGEFVVQFERDELSVLHISRNMVSPLRPLPTLVVPNEAEPWARGALAAAAGLMPDGFAARQVPMMPDLTGTGIHQPLRELQGSALLVSSVAAAEISFQRALAAEPLLDPRQLPVPPGGAALRSAAEYVLACTQPETLLRVAMHWAFACEVLHRPWTQNRDTLRFHALSGPDANLQQMKASAHRMVLPQLVRVIAIDAVYSRDSTGGETGDPSQLSTLVRTLVAEFFPSIDRSEPPSHPEIRTALWILSQDTPFADLGDGGPSTLMAYTFGLQSIGEPDDLLRRWYELVSLPDNHPHGSWVEGEAPSDLRSDLRTTSGLDLRDVAATVQWMLTRMMPLQYLSNQLLTMPTLVSLADSTQGSPAEDALSFVSDQLVTSIDQLRNDGPSNTGALDDHVAERRRSIEKRCHKRPFFQFDDGTIAPIRIPDTVYRTIELCQEAHNNQNESPQQRRQRIGNILGRCFEAHVKSLCHSLGTHHVIDSTIINKVIDREAGSDSKRADLVIGDSTGDYLAPILHGVGGGGGWFDTGMPF